MLTSPEKRISPKALKVWKIYGAILSFIVFALSIAATVAIFLLDLPKWIIPILVVVDICFLLIAVFFVPKIRWERWRYELREQEIELQHGLFVVKRTLIPIIRVQHVDTNQGPIMKKYRLASVVISSAATTHEIPALDEDEAEELRKTISYLVRVVREDV
jgi:membrane protein YdbS with pleckstrin-like domain